MHILFAVALLDAGGRDPGGYVKLCMDSMRGVVLFRDFCTVTSKLPVGTVQELPFRGSNQWEVVRQLCHGDSYLRVESLWFHLIDEDTKPWMEIVGDSGDVVVHWYIAGAALNEFGDEQYRDNYDYLEIDHCEYVTGSDHKFIDLPRNDFEGIHVNVLQVISGESKKFDPLPFFNR